MLEKVQEATGFLKNQGYDQAETGIILGTGLGNLINEIDIEKTLDYKDIPHFPISTVESHSGKLILGTIAGHKVIAMQGRFHYYEGYSMGEVVFPVRVMNMLGIKQLLISNAAGCMNLDWNKGELMLIEDHINLQPDNPLRGKEAASFGPIFTDLSSPYAQTLNEKIINCAEQLNVKLNRGVYVAVAGPSLETKAEYRFLRAAGADVVGMSTVPEVIAANQLGLPVAAISVLTDDCDPDNLQPINIQDILATAASAETSLIRVITELIKTL